MALQVIGAGFSRTATVSMRDALDRLGFGPCHHMMTLNADPGQRRMWRAVAKGAAPDWDRLYAGFRSGVDFPTAFWWRDLAALWPEAKVVLTIRDTESWWASFEPIARELVENTDDPDSLSVTLVARRVFGGRPLDRDHACAVYEAHNAAVLAAIPAGRLHVHRVGDGWEGLCAFLGVPVPDEPYPRTNSRAELLGAIARGRAERH